MLLLQKSTGKLVEVVDIYELANPFDKQLVGCLQWDEDVPDPQCFRKADLCFTSGEELPQCWTDERFGEERLAESFDREQPERLSGSKASSDRISPLL